jgi:hypothetical protein
MQHTVVAVWCCVRVRCGTRQCVARPAGAQAGGGTRAAQAGCAGAPDAGHADLGWCPLSIVSAQRLWSWFWQHAAVAPCGRPHAAGVCRTRCAAGHQRGHSDATKGSAPESLATIRTRLPSEAPCPLPAALTALQCRFPATLRRPHCRGRQCERWKGVRRGLTRHRAAWRVAGREGAGRHLSAAAAPCPGQRRSWQSVGCTARPGSAARGPAGAWRAPWSAPGTAACGSLQQAAGAVSPGPAVAAHASDLTLCMHRDAASSQVLHRSDEFFQAMRYRLTRPANAKVLPPGA